MWLHDHAYEARAFIGEEARYAELAALHAKEDIKLVLAEEGVASACHHIENHSETPVRFVMCSCMRWLEGGR